MKHPITNQDDARIELPRPLVHTVALMLALLALTGVASAREPVPDPHQPSAPLGLGLAWDDLPREEPEARDGLWLQIRNDGTEAVEINLAVLALGFDGRRADADLGQLTLERGHEEAVAVDLAEMPLQSIGVMSQGTVEVRATAGDGTAYSIFSEPFFYDFDAEYSQIQVYDRRLALGRFPDFEDGQLFDLQGRVLTPEGFVDIGELIDDPEADASIFGTSKELLDTDVEWPDVPSPWDGTQGVRACARWGAHFVDAGFGEDYLNQPSLQKVPAAFALAKIYAVGNSQPVWSGALDDEGCAPALKLALGKHVFAISTIHQTPEGQGFYTYHLSYDLENPGQQTALFKTGFKVQQQPVKVVKLWVDPVFQGPVTNVSAIVSHLLTRPDHGVTSGQYIIYADVGCPSYPGSSCAGTLIYLSPGSGYLGPHSDWKYIVGHELGHIVQRRAKVKLETSYFAIPPDPAYPLCNCDHVTVSNNLHCLQSLEDTTSAQVEGFGHFYAAMMFNDASPNDCTFVYYKEFLDFVFWEPTQPVLWPFMPPFPRDCAAPAQWRDVCSQQADTGTEYDWLGFYWAMYNQMTMDDLFQIYRDACGGTCYNAFMPWEQLRQAAEAYFGAGDPAYQAFVAAGAAYRVDNTFP